METQELQQLQDQLHGILQRKFGFKDFRSGQLHSMTTLLTKGRLLCILPTGYGKSLLYQLPACMLEGITVVISPLLALMRDQIDQLNHRFNIPSGAINSDQTDEENDIVRQAVRNSQLKILFVAPEQLDHVDRFEFLLNLNIKLVVVDEAHCISTWGHDFRPSYRQILQFLRAIHERHGDVKMLALTATANRRVEQDIAKQIFFSNQEPIVIRQGMDRPNIHLSVVKAKGISAKLEACEQLLKQIEGCGLIYCATRENTELVADYLRERGCNVTSYHAGYEIDKKRTLQEAFIKDKYKALAATNALGMGIDKGNLRFIIHFDVPGSITAYYQEVGRCGRDGQKAEGIMLYDPSDKNIHEYFIDSALPSPNDFDIVLQAIATAENPPGINAIKTLTGLHPTRVTIVVAELLEQGYISKYSLHGKQVYRVHAKEKKPDLSRYKIQEEVKTHELKQILHYGEQFEKCRMVVLRTSLGDDNAPNCQRCDACLGKTINVAWSPDKKAVIDNWMTKRPIIISPMVREKVSQGLSLLDGKMRSRLFVDFMKRRANCPDDSLGMDEALIELMRTQLRYLCQKHQIAGIILIPSRTWQARNRVAAFIGNELRVPVLDIITWNPIPMKRQGELLNNNQRHENVQHHMLARRQALRPGPYLLLDDYIGSGNTIKEAARALRAEGITNELIPFTFAAVKWRLGQKGFI